MTGKADVILCDGFSGNIILKFMESFFDTLRESSGKDIDVFKHYDYQQHGGVPILGIQGTSFICHGRSTAQAIYMAMKQAVEFHESKFHEIMSQHPLIDK
jgi:glycerol-3-phosphate acyltransferase PlsX